MPPSSKLTKKLPLTGAQRRANDTAERRVRLEKRVAQQHSIETMLKSDSDSSAGDDDNDDEISDANTTITEDSVVGAKFPSSSSFSSSGKNINNNTTNTFDKSDLFSTTSNKKNQQKQQGTSSCDENDDDDDDDDENDEDDTIQFLDECNNNKDKEKNEKKTNSAVIRGRGGVVYLGRIPHGFYETEMRSYFSQFGTVSRLRLSRNKKTGRSKHYAFIEFSDSAVADIVAQTMNGYLLFGHLLVCKTVKPSELHAETFKGCEKKFQCMPRGMLQARKHNVTKTAEQLSRLVQRHKERFVKKEKRLENLGIVYSCAA